MRCMVRVHGQPKPHLQRPPQELTQPRWGGVVKGGGAPAVPCHATVPPHRVCRVTRGRRCGVLCEGDRHLCHLCRLCRPCHHDTEWSGGEGGGGAIGKCAAARAVT